MDCWHWLIPHAWRGFQIPSMTDWKNIRLGSQSSHIWNSLTVKIYNKWCLPTLSSALTGRVEEGGVGDLFSLFILVYLSNYSPSFVILITQFHIVFVLFCSTYGSIYTWNEAIFKLKCEMGTQSVSVRLYCKEIWGTESLLPTKENYNSDQFNNRPWLMEIYTKI